MYDGKKLNTGFSRGSISRRLGSKGVLMVELIIACLIIAVAILTLISTYSLVAAMAAKSRNQIKADMIVKSMIDRIRAHRYGDPEPYNWKGQEIIRIIPEVPVSEALKVSKVSMFTFKRDIDYENKSFIGKGSQDYDIITITVSWAESHPGMQDRSSKGKGKGKKEAVSAIKAVMEVRRPVPDQYKLQE